MQWIKPGIRNYIAPLLLLLLVLAPALPAAAQPLVVDAGLLNVRSGPGTDHGVITQVPRGTVLTAVDDREAWSQVVLPDRKTGWVSSRYTSLFLPERYATVDVTLLNVRGGPGTNHSVVTQFTRGLSVPVLEESNDWLRVLLPEGGQGWLAGWFTEAAEFRGYVTVTASLLNFRSGPGTGYTALDRLPRGELLAVLERSGDWLKVARNDGSTGWVHGGYTTQAEGSEGSDEEEPPDEILDQVKVTASLLNFRSGPGTGYTALDQLPRGELLAVLERSGDWLKVARNDGSTGWVHGGYTTQAEGSEGSPPPPPGPLAGKTIVIDPGHGGPDPGAVGVTGYYEKTVNLAVALELAPLLRNAGANVLMTRWSDLNPTLWQRVNLANSNGADAFVSIHANSHTGSWANGTETYYNPWNASSGRSRILAQHLQQQLVSALGFPDRGVKTAGFYVISNTRMPSALVELGFLSNHREESVLRQPQTHRSAAEALHRGLENFFR